MQIALNQRFLLVSQSLCFLQNKCVNCPCLFNGCLGFLNAQFVGMRAWIDEI